MTCIKSRKSYFETISVLHNMFIAWTLIYIYFLSYWTLILNKPQTKSLHQFDRNQGWMQRSKRYD